MKLVVWLLVGHEVGWLDVKLVGCEVGWCLFVCGLVGCGFVSWVVMKL